MRGALPVAKSSTYSIRFTEPEQELAIAVRQRMGEQTIADVIRSLMAGYAKRQGLETPAKRPAESLKYNIRLTPQERALAVTICEQMGKQTIADVIRDLLADYASQQGMTLQTRTRRNFPRRSAF
jgi:hypothetical protein